MKKLLNSLPFRLLLGIVVGVLLGQVFPLGAMKVVVTLQYIMGQLITFCVPLIVIGFIAPSITRLGKNASRLLGVAIVIAYTSSVCAAFMSTGAGYALIPHLSIDTEVAGLRELPEVVFELNIPQIMSVMSALVLSVLVGLAATWTNSKLTCDLLGEFQNIVLSVVSKIIIPILPFYIAATFCNLSYEGMITHQLPAFIQIILIVMAGHYIWLAPARTRGRSSAITARPTSPPSAPCPAPRRWPLRWTAPARARCCAKIWSASVSRCSQTSTSAARC